MHSWALVLNLFALAASGCGGTFESANHSDGGDAGDEPAPTDGAVRDVRNELNECLPPTHTLGEGGCFDGTPTAGDCCDVGWSICQVGDPCCVGAWACNSSTHTWVHEELGCACRIDAGPPPDAPTDTGSPTACGAQTCAPSDICVEQTTSGGPCLAPNDAGMCPPGSTLIGGCCGFSSTTFACKPEPAGCGGTLSCGCAKALCSCMCSGASDRTLMCACLGA